MSPATHQPPNHGTDNALFYLHDRSGHLLGLSSRPEFSQPVRRTRASKPKVRTACVTCKIRRIKCDETRPACQRCTSTGRKCDGYMETQEQRKPKRDAAMALLLCKSPDTHTGTSGEIRALEFFFRNTAPQLASYFDAEFWTRLIFQMSHAESAVRHAMIALGTLSEQRVDDRHRGPYVGGQVQKDKARDFPNPTTMNLPLTRPDAEKEATFATMHYHKAIMELSARINSADVPIETVLLACILFVCLEFMRGDVQPALRHFKGGMSVALASLTESSTITEMAAHRIRQNMLPFFNRLELLSIVLGSEVDWEYGVLLEDAVPPMLRNIRQARDSLVHLMNISLRFIRSNGFRRYRNLDMTEDQAKQRTIFAQLDKWQCAFDDLVLSDSISPLELDGAKILRLHHQLSTIWTGIALRPDECKNDEWSEQYETCVKLAEAVCGSPQAVGGAYGHSHGSRFLFDMEIVSSLWFVVVKCRHPVIRRRATQILKTTTRREGLYDAPLAGAIAECLMAIEEKNLKVFDGSEMPAECDRIHYTAVTVVSPDRYRLTHHYRPHGLDEPLETLCEEIQLVHDVNPDCPSTTDSAACTDLASLPC